MERARNAGTINWLLEAPKATWDNHKWMRYRLACITVYARVMARLSNPSTHLDSEISAQDMYAKLTSILWKIDPSRATDFVTHYVWKPSVTSGGYKPAKYERIDTPVPISKDQMHCMRTEDEQALLQDAIQTVEIHYLQYLHKYISKHDPGLLATPN